MSIKELYNIIRSVDSSNSGDIPVYEFTSDDNQNKVKITFENALGSMIMFVDFNDAKGYISIASMYDEGVFLLYPFIGKVGDMFYDRVDMIYRGDYNFKQAVKSVEQEKGFLYHIDEFVLDCIEKIIEWGEYR